MNLSLLYQCLSQELCNIPHIRGYPADGEEMALEPIVVRTIRLRAVEHLTNLLVGAVPFP
jgi:hypothetical protein